MAIGRRAIGRKGMFFTIMTVIFLAIFISYATISTYYGLSEKMFSIESRVDTMDDFIDGVKKDIERGLYISSFRAILTLQQYIIDRGVFIDGVEEKFEEALLKGTIYSTEAPLMQESTFTDWINAIANEAGKININLSIEVNEINIYQESPWRITVDSNITLSLIDKTGLASWKTNEYIKTHVNAEGFEDPLYILNFHGKATNVINRTLYDGNYTYIDSNGWNAANLLEHVKHSYYAPNQDAPSFLMRLEGNMGGSPYGIESLINLQRLSYSGITLDYEKSIVEHVYFSDNETVNYRTNITPSWIKIDSGHLAKYNVSQLAII